MILISRSFGRKMAATTTVAVAFVGLYTVTAMDSNSVPLFGREARVPFNPTSGKPVYCSDCFRSQRGG